MFANWMKPALAALLLAGLALPAQAQKTKLTIYTALEVTELTPGRSTGVVTLRSTVFNQRKELVLEGTQKFLIRRRPA